MADSSLSYPESDYKAELAKHQVAPRLSMLDWRNVLTALYLTSREEVARRLVEAMVEDEACEGVPTAVFGLLMFVPDRERGG